MNINRGHIRVAACASAIALLLQIAPAGAERKRDRNGPVEITFTKWVTGTATATVLGGVQEGRVLMAGLTGGDIPGAFAGEVLQRQPSANTALKAGIIKLEAIYEVLDPKGDHVLTALIRGGTNQVTGAALLEGVVLGGWRTGAKVQVEFQTILGTPGVSCVAGAPAGATCFEGTIHVARAPTGDD